MTLTKAEILNADDLPLETVEVPEWGGSVCVRVITGAERDRFEADCTNKAVGMENIRARLASLCVCDEAGKRLFSNGECKELGGKSSAALNRIFQAAQKLNVFTEDEIDEIAGN